MTSRSIDHCKISKSYSSAARSPPVHKFDNDRDVILMFKMYYNIPRACLLNRSPVLAMDLKSNRSDL